MIYIPQTKLELFLDALSDKGFKFDRKNVDESVLARGIFRVFLLNVPRRYAMRQKI